MKRRRHEQRGADQSQVPSTAERTAERHEGAEVAEQPWCSSTMSLVEGVNICNLIGRTWWLTVLQAFHFHNSSRPDTSMTTALTGGQILRQTEEVSPESNPCQSGRGLARHHTPNLWQQGSRLLAAALASLLPSREVAALLVDTYFDRVHWFVLIFHQDDFRQTWQEMYEIPRENLVERFQNTGFISTFLVVIAIGLQYSGTHRRGLLDAHNIDPVAMKENIFSTIRAKVLDIVSLGSLEAVQTCVLLGTYYLYHGNPRLAWPVCGCGLRIAQALNLHRKLITGPMSSEMLRQYETRKRCWWAIYEIETFCSMSYGYPHSIKDADCDVELLDPLAKLPNGQSPATFDTTHQCPASLLSYKYLMSKLSVLVKDILTELYGLGSFKRNTQHGRQGRSSVLPSLMCKVSSLDDRLRKWKSEIPSPLQLNNACNSAAAYNSVEEMDRDIGASGPRFERHIYQLQALALDVAYENARILLHRPLLTYKTIPQGITAIDDRPTSDPLQTSLQNCREAALKTSDIEATPIFSLAADTYAAAFIGIHTFTAGVTLCILTSIEPLSPHSYHCKLGLRRLLSMQVHLKSRSHSALAAQGVEILERLTRLAMEKELQEVLTSSGSKEQVPIQRTSTEGGEGSIPVANEADLDNLPPRPAETNLNESAAFDYVQDPAVSQALYDFDQGKAII